MILHRSNRTEALVERLVDLVAIDPPGPFEAETIIVQGHGMARWLSMALADRLGIWAHPRFLFPLEWMELVLDAVLGPGGDAASAFAPETLMWSIVERLPHHLDDPSFAPIARYLAGDADGRRRVQLAEHIAKTFHRYLSYRPDVVRAWETGRDEGAADPGDDDRWQPVLWRDLVDRHGSDHLAARIRALLDAFEKGVARQGTLPRRVFVFGISTLPPLILSALDAISGHVDVHVFVLSPSREYWAEIRSPSESGRAREDRIDVDEAALHLEEGHPLLASMGRLGRDLQSMLEDVGYMEDSLDLYRDPTSDGASMLTSLQSDMLHLRDGESSPPDEGDRSISVHACHGPMREVEVLREELLACFEASPDLEPRDVVVMTPDIDAYAPYIEAVFAPGEAEIPHRIADRGADAGAEVIAAFRSGLDFVQGRFEAAAGLDLLGWSCVRARFGIADGELQQLRRWIEESGIRWAADAQHRIEHDQPAYEENTWRFGLDRLLLGVAVDADDLALYRDVRPLPGVEGARAELLGRFAEFCEFCFAQRQSLRGRHTPRLWQRKLFALLDGLMGESDENAQLQRMIRRVLLEIAERAEAAGFHGDVSLASMREQMERALSRVATPYGFLSGGVTFCELVPMRSIPFRVVCLMGMNDEAYPRIRHPLGFDLIARRRRPGDRSDRDDDRYLFLEALLAARDRLVITYVGQSVRDGKSIPPSVVVDELLDCVAVDESARERLVVKHPLQAFSPRYFDGADDARLFSHSAMLCEAARRLVGAPGPAPVLVDAVVDAPAESADEAAYTGAAEATAVIALDELARFWEHPIRAFVTRRMRLALLEADVEPASREPFDVVALERWRLGDEMLARALEGAPLETDYELVRASGALPHGSIGRLHYASLAGEVGSLVERHRDATAGDAPSVVDVDLVIAGARIHGRLNDVHRDGLVRCSYTQLGGRSELGFWVLHLVLQCAAAGDPRFAARAWESRLIGRPAPVKSSWTTCFTAVEDAASLLESLVQLYRLGQTAPLPLYPRSSRVYVERWLAKRDEDAAITAARKEFYNDRASTADMHDRFIDLVLGDREPWNPDGVPPLGLSPCDLARGVFEGLLGHRTEGR